MDYVVFDFKVNHINTGEIFILKNRTGIGSMIQETFEVYNKFCVKIMWNRKFEMQMWLLKTFGEPDQFIGRWYLLDTLVIAFKTDKDRTWFLMQSW